MSDTTKPAFSGAANTSQLGRWLGMSRNRVEEFSAALGVLPAGKKFPEHRLITGLLGLDIGNAAIIPMTSRLMTLAEAAAELGYSAQDLKTKIENGEIAAPPMYVFGERSRRFIRHQFLAYSRDPRGRFASYAFLPDFLMSLDDLAREAGLQPDTLKEEFEAGCRMEPVHVIFEGGRKRYFRTHAESIFKQSNRPEDPAAGDGLPAFSGGILGQVARAAAGAGQA